MKKIIILSVFICLFLIPTYSQINGQFKIDTTLRDRSIFGYQKSFKLKLSDKIDFNYPFNDSLNNKLLRFPKYSDRNFDIASNSTRRFIKSRSYDNMPCVRPEGYFPMAIVKPDSTIRYSLRIIRY